MSGFQLAALLVGIAAFFGYVNYRTLRLPDTVGILVFAIAASMALLGIDRAIPEIGIRGVAQTVLQKAALPDAFLNGILGLLLFAGALHVDLPALLSRKWTVLTLATGGVVIATTLMGFAMFFVFDFTGFHLPLVWCLLLGALIAPTDPVAVLDVLGRVGLRRSLKAVIVGESLFNDGVAVVLFTILLAVEKQGAGALSGSYVAMTFLLEAGGGALLGLATGYLAFLAMRSIDKYEIELMISLCLAMVTYSLADAAGMSGPISVVVAGLVTGHHGTRYAMSETTRRNLQIFWMLVDQILNALLFLLIGFQLLVLPLDAALLAPVAIALFMTLLIRAVSLLPGFLLHLHIERKPAILAVLTWSGIRGGVSIALALSLPAQPERVGVLAVCYAIVIFSIVVQGLTLEPVVRWALPANGESGAEDGSV